MKSKRGEIGWGRRKGEGEGEEEFSCRGGKGAKFKAKAEGGIDCWAKIWGPSWPGRKEEEGGMKEEGRGIKKQTFVHLHLPSMHLLILLPTPRIASFFLTPADPIFSSSFIRAEQKARVCRVFPRKRQGEKKRFEHLEIKVN
jgi:hypothetical protein